MNKNRVIIIIMVIIVIIGIYLCFKTIFSGQNDYVTGLNTFTISNTEIENDRLIVDGYLHNSITVFSGHDYRIQDDCMYIAIKVNTKGKAKEGIKGGSIHFEVVIPDYVKKVYLEDKNSNKIIYQKDMT